MENIQKLLCEMQVDFICASKNTGTNALSGRITWNRYNWIAVYTIIMLVYKITWILKISRGLLANQDADSEYNV